MQGTLTKKERRQRRDELLGITPEASRRRDLDHRCEPDRGDIHDYWKRPWKQTWKASSLRRKYFDQVNDGSQLPKPLPPRPPRRDKRAPSKPR